jgi:predicted ribosomally synthesized peptide with nif11-like leader
MESHAMEQNALTEFLKKVETNEVLRSQLLTAASPEETKLVAARHGFTIPNEDLPALAARLNSSAEGEISEENLKLVTGGGDYKGGRYLAQEMGVAKATKTKP